MEELKRWRTSKRGGERKKVNEKKRKTKKTLKENNNHMDKELRSNEK